MQPYSVDLGLDEGHPIFSTAFGLSSASVRESSDGRRWLASHPDQFGEARALSTIRTYFLQQPTNCISRRRLDIKVGDLLQGRSRGSTLGGYAITAAALVGCQTRAYDPTGTQLSSCTPGAAYTAYVFW